MAHVKMCQEIWGVGVMNILVVDSDRADRKKLVKMLKKLKKGSEIFVAEDDDGGYEIAMEYDLDVAFIDTSPNSPGACEHGLLLTKKLKEIFPEINVIFLSKEADHYTALEGWRMHVCGYVVKPVTMEKLEEEFLNLHYPIIGIRN
ncbi:MAG: response regulator [Lachnospiraceae bacterium]|nr:response regulator [Lachnospiraceae bacterium]